MPITVQHGFMRGKSCETQLLEVYSEIGTALDSGIQSNMIFIDFSKAFDSVNHNLLLYKLNSMGFSGSLLKWFSSYLCDRRQRVMVEGNFSEYCSVTSAVTQGYILGPILFILYINDMPNVNLSSKLMICAGDAKCYRSVSSINDCKLLQHDLDLLFDWSVTWKLNFNVDKCKILSITRNKVPLSFQYTVI